MRESLTTFEYIKKKTIGEAPDSEILGRWVNNNARQKRYQEGRCLAYLRYLQMT